MEEIVADDKEAEEIVGQDLKTIKYEPPTTSEIDTLAEKVGAIEPARMLEFTPSGPPSEMEEVAQARERITAASVDRQFHDDMRARIADQERLGGEERSAEFPGLFPRITTLYGDPKVVSGVEEVPDKPRVRVLRIKRIDGSRENSAHVKSTSGDGRDVATELIVNGLQELCGFKPVNEVSFFDRR